MAELARPTDSVAVTRSSEILGTPQDMAPEQCRGTIVPAVQE